MRRGLNTIAMLGMAAALALPGAAQAAAPQDSQAGMAEAGRMLANPGNQKAAAGALAALIEGLMQIKAAPFAKAMDQMGDHEAARHIPDGATLGDLAGPDARNASREVSVRVPQMMTAMAGMTEAMGRMLPQLEAMARDMGQQIEHAAPAS